MEPHSRPPAQPTNALPPTGRRTFLALAHGASRRGRGRGAGHSVRRLLLRAARSARSTGSIWGRSPIFRSNETRLVDLRQPAPPAVGRHDGAHRRVRPLRGQETTKRADQFLVLAVNCAHLGCPVSWFPQSGLFMCPCHGGVYYANGERASGPPPRGLFHCVWRVQDGQLEIQAPHYPTLQDTLDRKPLDGNEATPMVGWLKTIGNWFDARLGFSDTLLPMLRHPVPRAIAGPMGWWYVFGSASLTLLADPDPHRHRPGAGLRARRPTRPTTACCT